MKQIIIFLFLLQTILSAPVDNANNEDELESVVPESSPEKVNTPDKRDATPENADNDEKVDSPAPANSAERATPDKREAGKVSYDIEVDVGKITFNSDLNDLSYSYRLETADGTIKHETGRFEDENLVAEGGYEYIGDNGLKYSVTYVADKDGYRPKVSFGTKASGGISARSAKSVDTNKTETEKEVEKPAVVEDESADLTAPAEPINEPAASVETVKIAEPEESTKKEETAETIEEDKAEKKEE